MIISQPNDGRGLLYHVVDLLGQTVHAYRDLGAATRSLEGDQRIFILQEPINGRENRWLTGAPYPDVPQEEHLQAGTLGVPHDVVQAAFKVSRWFAARNVEQWQLGDCQKRDYSTLPGDMALSLLRQIVAQDKITYSDDAPVEYKQLANLLNEYLRLAKEILAWFMADIDGDVVPGLPVYGD